MQNVGIRRIVLSGPPRERGRAHGEAFRPLIHDYLGRWKQALENQLHLDPDAYLEKFVQDTQLVAAVDRWTPELLEEVRGIGQGAAVPFDLIFAWQCYLAIDWYNRARLLDLLRPEEHCTALGAARQSRCPTLIAQNLDLPRRLEGAALIQHHKLPDTDLELLVVGSVGSIGDSGVNSRSIGLVENTVAQLEHSMQGVPDFFVARGVLLRRTFDAAVEFMRSVPHACGHNYVIGSPDRVIDLECSANQVVRYMPVSSGARVWHTNHPLVNDDTGQWRHFLSRVPEERRQQMTSRSTSEARLAGAERALRDESQPVTIDAVKTLLCSHDAPICQHSDRVFTASAIIHVLTDTPELYITNGPPCSSAYQHLAF